MTPDEHAEMQRLEGLVKRYRSRIVVLKDALRAVRTAVNGLPDVEPEIRASVVTHCAEALRDRND